MPQDADLIAGTSWLLADERFDQHLDYLSSTRPARSRLASVVAMGSSAEEPRSRRRSDATRPADPGRSPAGHRGQALGPRFPPRRLRHRRSGSRHLPRSHLPAPARSLQVHLHRLLRRPARPDPITEKRTLLFSSEIEASAPRGSFLAGDALRLLPEERTGRAGHQAARGRTSQTGVLRRDGQDEDGGPRRHPDREPVQRAGQLPDQSDPRRASAPWTSSRARKRPWSSSRWPPPRPPDLPRDIDFLFSANRLNVALSRAQCLAILIASPDLLATPCRTVPQLRLVNKFCLLAELSPGFSRWRARRPAKAGTPAPRTCGGAVICRCVKIWLYV